MKDSTDHTIGTIFLLLVPDAKRLYMNVQKTMGFQVAEERCLVYGTVPQPLLLLPLLCAGNVSISNLWVNRVVPSTLPGPLPRVYQTHAGVYRQNDCNPFSNDARQTTMCVHLSAGKTCSKWPCTVYPGAHAPSPQMDPPSRQSPTVPLSQNNFPETKGD